MDPLKSDPFWSKYDYVRQEVEECGIFPLIVDVAIIGAGMTGVSTAFWLKEMNYSGKIAIFEKCDKISDGATGRNGGHCVVAAKEINDEAYQYECDTVNLIEDYLKKYDPQNLVEYVKTGMLHVTKNPIVADEWKKKDLRKGIRLLDSHEVQQKIKLNDFVAGLWIDSAAQFWPAKFVYSLAKIITQRGVNIYVSTVVNRVEKDNSENPKIKFQLYTSNGIISANRIVFATNAYVSALIPSLQEIISPTRGQVIATKPLPLLFPFSFSIDDGEYMIQRKNDGRIIFGGFRMSVKGEEKNITDDSCYNPIVHNNILYFLEKFYSSKENLINYEWTGIMGFSVDGYPIVGEFEDNLYIGCGFSGHGMPRCFKVGKDLASIMLKNNEVKVPSTFDCKRFPMLKLKINQTDSKL